MLSYVCTLLSANDLGNYYCVVSYFQRIRRKVIDEHSNFGIIYRFHLHFKRLIMIQLEIAIKHSCMFPFLF